MIFYIVCTTDDDCFGSGFCGNAIPSYGSNYFESDIVDIPGEESTYISKAERFDGLRIIRRPATDHPNLDMDLTITTYIQQDPSNSGYVIAKGFDDQMRDWGLLLAYNRIAIVYRTNTGSYETVTFSGITVADGYNYSVSAVIDGTNNQAFISVNGEVTAITLNRQPEFRPGVSCLYICSHNSTLILSCSLTFCTLVEGLKQLRQLTIGLKEQFTIYQFMTPHCPLMTSRS